MKSMKKLLIVMLTLIVIVGMVCSCSSSDPEEQGGSIQGAATEENPWKIGAEDEDSVTAYIIDGTLWISGDGEMVDYADPTDRPWNDYAGDITEIFLDSGVKSVGQNAFYEIGKNTDGADIFMGSDVETIGADSFEGMNFTDYCILTFPEDLDSIGSNAFANSNLGEIYFDGKPDSIAEDAFSGMTATIHVRANENWSDSEKSQFGGTLTYKTLYAFSYEDIYEGDEMSGEGTEYCDSDQEYTFDAEMQHEEGDGYVFDHFELIEGNISIENPSDPVITTMLTDDVKVKVYFSKE